jgi:hypothetical protein
MDTRIYILYPILSILPFGDAEAVLYLPSICIHKLQKVKDLS